MNNFISMGQSRRAVFNTAKKRGFEFLPDSDLWTVVDPDGKQLHFSDAEQAIEHMEKFKK